MVLASQVRVVDWARHQPEGMDVAIVLAYQPEDIDMVIVLRHWPEDVDIAIMLSQSCR